MHILHINLAKGFRGGERQTALLIDGLANAYPKLQQSLIIRSNSPLSDALTKSTRVNIIRVKRPTTAYLLGLKKEFDIVHAHEAKACHFAYLLSLCKNIPYILTRRMDRAPKTNWFTKKVYQHSSHIVSLSSAIDRIINNYQSNLSTSIIPSMAANLPTNTLSIAEIRKSYPEKTLIGHVGALVQRHKGQQYIIEAARHLETTHPHLHFLLIGEGQDEAILKLQAKGLTNIEFLGFKSNIGDYLCALDIFIFPSLQEGLGSTLLDAMEASLPIIASIAGGIPDIIKHEKNGLLIPPQDYLAIVNAVLLLVENKSLAETVGKQGKAEATQYSPYVISQRYMEIYKTICDSKT
jgi:glycosyltransferase involved in cell wall biosynthesis